jgi:hypothetical protein
VESSACFAWPCFFIGISLDCLSMSVTGYHAWLTVKPLSLLKLLVSSQISIASFTSQSTYPLTFPSIAMLLKSVLCPVSMLHSTTADFSGWLRHMSHVLFVSGPSGSVSLSNIYFTALAGDTVFSRDLQTQCVN